MRDKHVLYIFLYNCREGALDIVIDTSVIIAVIANEPVKEQLIELTKETTLMAPASLHWEVGNAFSAMFKRKLLTLNQAQQAIESYQQIPIAFKEVSLSSALELAQELGIYAYDAYMIGCAQNHKAPLLTLDKGLIDAAKRKEIVCLEVLS